MRVNAKCFECTSCWVVREARRLSKTMKDYPALSTVHHLTGTPYGCCTPDLFVAPSRALTRSVADCPSLETDLVKVRVDKTSFVT